MGNLCGEVSADSQGQQSTMQQKNAVSNGPTIRHHQIGGVQEEKLPKDLTKRVQWADDQDELEEGETGDSDTDHEVESSTLKISDRQKFFNGKKSLRKFVKRNLNTVDQFNRVECFGNSYDEQACTYIAELIKTRSSDDLCFVDFSNMFVTRQATLPSSLRILIQSIQTKPIQELNLHDNAFGPIGVAQFEDFLRNATCLKRLSVTNCGLGPEATTTIANALIANEHTKLESLCISRSRVETKGALALAEYFETYFELQKLQIFQNGIRDEGSIALASSLKGHAESGSLTHLELHDNFFCKEDSLAELISLINCSSGLEHLNIGSSNIEDEDQGRQLLEAFKETICQGTLQRFSWSYDAFEQNDLIKDFLEVLGDQELFPKLTHIELCETLTGARRRNKLRAAFKEKNITLILSDRQVDEDEPTDSEADSGDDEDSQDE